MGYRYEQFQISDNPAGNCEALSNAVFVGAQFRQLRRIGLHPVTGIEADASLPTDPFAGVDLATVSDATLDAANTMARAAVELVRTLLTIRI